jgi:hypothetical protein
LASDTDALQQTQKKAAPEFLRSRCGKYDRLIVGQPVAFLFRVFSARAVVLSGRPRLQEAARHLSAAVRLAADTRLVPFLARRALRQGARPQVVDCQVDLTQSVAVDVQERAARIPGHPLEVRQIFRVPLLSAERAEYSQYRH